MKVTAPDSSNELKKVLGVFFGVAVGVGGTIGAGILRAPGSIAALLPDATLIITCWIAIGVYILLAASSYAELTAMLPKAGGAYNYIKRGFGNYAGFVNGWFDFLSNAIAPAYFCIVLNEYFILIFPQLASYSKLPALFFLTLFTAINLPSVRSGSFTQRLTSTIKIILFLVLIIGCFLHTPETGSEAGELLIKGGLFAGLFGTLQLIMGTYDGCMSVSFFAEEDTNPQKNIPRSYMIGALTIAIMYVLINAAILYVLPVSEVANAPLAASKAAAVAFGDWSGTLMTAVAIFSLISILNAYMMIPSRILFGLGRDGFFIPQSTKINKGGTPYVSLLICYGFAFILIIYSSFEMLFNLGALMMLIVTGFAFASLIRLRKTEPELERPYRAIGYPFTTWLTLLITITLFIGFAINDVLSLTIVTVITLLSFIGYRLLVKSKHQKNEP